MSFIKIDYSMIESALDGTTRQYLAGNLARPQRLKYISTGDLEIGITAYLDATPEPPHWHQIASEYQLMLKGSTVYHNSITEEEISFIEGDFYFIETGTCYSQHSKAGTRILFIKHPSINDKITCKHCRRKCPNRLEPFQTDLPIEISTKISSPNVL